MREFRNGRGVSVQKKEWKVVATFQGMHDAIKAEELCKKAGLEGRLIPTPADITADCGMAYMMPLSEKDRFIKIVSGNIAVDGLYERYLR